MIKPITPSRASSQKPIKVFPDEVIEAFNELIAQSYDGHSAVVKQSHVVDLICKKMNITEMEVAQNHYLDIEKVYGSSGWLVDYDKPGRDESYTPTFTFTKK